jgi:hypothetical protein
MCLEPGIKEDRLGEGGRTGCDAARNDGRNRNYYAGHFKLVNRGNQNDDGRSGGDDASRCRADRTEMRIHGPGVELQATVHLRCEKDDPEEQDHEVESL